MSTIYKFDPQQADIGGSNYYLIVEPNAGGVILNVPDVSGTNHAFNFNNDATRSLANALARSLSTYGDQTVLTTPSVFYTDGTSGLTLTQPAFAVPAGGGVKLQIPISSNPTFVVQLQNPDVQAFANALSHYLATWQ